MKAHLEMVRLYFIPTFQNSEADILDLERRGGYYGLSKPKNCNGNRREYILKQLADSQLTVPGDLRSQTNWSTDLWL